MKKSYFNQIKKDFTDDDILNKLYDNMNLGIIDKKSTFWLMDCGNDKVAWTATAECDSEYIVDATAIVNKLLKLLKNFPPVVKLIIQKSLPEKIIPCGFYDRNIVSSFGYANGFKRTTILGDAAHPVRPTLGLGSTLAFEDSVCLAKKLSNNSINEALKLYEQERIPIISKLIEKALQATWDDI